MTSRDVVNRIHRLVRPAKAGHAGTLDPLACGVLVIGIGAATRLIQYVQRMPKCYRATFLLGRASDTDDIEGQVELFRDARVPTEEELTGAIRQWEGMVDQVPPVYSAVKVKGKRAYARARSGEAFTIPARRVRIDAIRLRHYAYPTLQLDIDCGSGVYVRALGRDIAEMVGTRAVMSDLLRTAIGPFHACSALDPEAFTLEQIEAGLLPLASATAALPQVVLEPAEQRRIGQGQILTFERGELDRRSSRASLPAPEGHGAQSIGGSSSEYAAVDDQGHLLAIVRREGNRLRAVKNMPRAAEP